MANHIPDIFHGVDRSALPVAHDRTGAGDLDVPTALHESIADGTGLGMDAGPRRLGRGHDRLPGGNRSAKYQGVHLFSVLTRYGERGCVSAPSGVWKTKNLLAGR